MYYLKFAGPLAIGTAALLILLGLIVPLASPESDLVPVLTAAKGLMIATAGGAIGALLSIAIGIRARTVATDGDIRTNALDGSIRVLIGVVSAAVLYLFFDSGVVKGLPIGTVQVTGGESSISLALGFLIGFAAGFLERLVPDLLEKNSSVAGKAVGGVVPSSPSGAINR
jgi:hypothetical protein